MVCLDEVFLVTCAFSKEKVHSLSVAPEPLAIWNKELEGLVLKLVSSKGSRAYTRVLYQKELGYSSVQVLFVLRP